MPSGVVDGVVRRVGVVTDRVVRAEPARPWTTTSPASDLDVSRATLSRRFVAATGQSPAAYPTQWRMDLAAVRLRREPVEAVAARVGCQSVPAFSRAFARSRGTTPGRYRAARPGEPHRGPDADRS